MSFPISAGGQDGGQVGGQVGGQGEKLTIRQKEVLELIKADPGIFFISSLTQAWLGLKNKKPRRFCARAFFLVAECDQISNLNLVEDIYKILILIDSEISV